MSVDLRLLPGLGALRETMGVLGLYSRSTSFAGTGVSRAVSNVPAAIALAEYSKDWRLIACGVTVGGFGVMMGSFANEFGLRLSGDRKPWVTVRTVVE